MGQPTRYIHHQPDAKLAWLDAGARGLTAMSEQPALEFGRAFDAYQSFVLATKLYWTRELYPALKRKVAQTNPVEARSADDIEAFAAKDIDYALFSWLERHLQQMKYSGHFRHLLKKCFQSLDLGSQERTSPISTSRSSNGRLAMQVLVYPPQYSTQ